MSAPEFPARPFGLRLWLALAVAVISGLVFLPALDGQFLTWDDNTTLTGNHAYRGLGAEQLRFMFTTALLGHYMPLTWLSFGVSYVLGGMDPRGYHLASLLLHSVNAGLVTLIAWRLIGAARRGGVTAAVPGSRADGAADGGPTSSLAVGATAAGLAFGVHPLRAETVAWATDRGDALCGVFYLGAVLAYCRAVQEGGDMRWRPWGALALASMAAALLSKELAVTLPVALVILDAYPFRRHRRWADRLREKVPFLALALAGGVVALLARSAGARFSSTEQYDLSARLAMTGYSFWYYAAAFAVPSGLAPYHEPPAQIRLLTPRFLGAVLAVVLVTAVLLALRRRWPAGLAAWAYYCAVVLPVSGVVHSGSHLVAERYAYLSTVGFCLLLGGAAAAAAGWGRQSSSNRWVADAVLAALALVIASWAPLAWSHSGSWRDTLTFWRTSVAADPGCRLCALNLAAAHFNAGHLPEAEAWSRRAIELWPDRGTPRHRLGAALLAQGKDRDAERELREAIRLAPRLAEAHRELGRLYARQGRAADARAELTSALALGAPRAEIEALLRSLEGPASAARPAP